MPLPARLLSLAVRQHLIERSKTPFMHLLLLGLWLCGSGLLGAVNSFGMPHLYWHANPWYHCSASLGIGFFVGVWCWVSLLMDSDKRWLREGEFALVRWSGLGSFDIGRVFTYVMFSATILDAVFALSHACYSWQIILPAQIPSVVAPLKTFVWIWLGSCFFVFIQLTAYRFRGMWLYRFLEVRVGRCRRNTLAQNRRRAGPTRDQKLAPDWMHANAIVSGLLVYGAVGMVAIFGWVSGQDFWMDVASRWPAWIRGPVSLFGSPVWYFCLLLTCIALTYGPFVYFRQTGLLWSLGFTVLGIGVIWLAGVRRPQYDIPGLSRGADYRTLLAAELVPWSESVDETVVLRRWQTRQQQANSTANNVKPKLVVVAVSGGGIRAQVWAMNVLCALERQFPGFPFHVRIVAGASGGMVGATYYVATLAPPTSAMQAIHYPRVTDRIEALQQPLTHDQMIDQMSRDTLTPVVRTFFYNDFLGYFFPTRDRGAVLEDAWAKYTRDRHGNSAFNASLTSLRNGEEAGWRPSLVFTPTISEDGRRLYISNRPLDGVVTERASQEGLPATAHSVSGLQLSRAYSGHQLQLKTAARLSANFPLIVPSPRLPASPDLHLMDAAYYDNYGVDVAAQYLLANREVIRSLDISGVLLLQISASRLNRVTSSAKSGALPEAGFIGTSFQKSIFMTDRTIARLEEYYNSSDPAFFTTFALEYDGPVSLSWYLTPSEVYALMLPFLRDELPGVDQNYCGFTVDGLPARLRDNVITGREIAGRLDDEQRSRLDETARRINAQFRRLDTWWNN